MNTLWIPIVGFPLLVCTIGILLYIKLRNEQKQTDARLSRVRRKSEEVAKYGAQPSDEIFEQPAIADIQGQWRMVSVGKRGRFAPPEFLANSNILFTISGDSYEILPAGSHGQIVVDSSQCPAHLDQLSSNGELNRCIVRIRNGELEICQAEVGDKRPSNFSPNRYDNASLTRFAKAD